MEYSTEYACSGSMFLRVLQRCCLGLPRGAIIRKLPTINNLSATVCCMGGTPECRTYFQLDNSAWCGLPSRQVVGFIIRGVSRLTLDLVKEPRAVGVLRVRGGTESLEAAELFLQLSMTNYPIYSSM